MAENLKKSGKKETPKSPEAMVSAEWNHKPFSKGFMNYNFTLSNGRSINVMHHIYRRASVAFYNISVILQIIARDEKSKSMVEEAHKYLVATSEELTNMIDARYQEINKLCQENGISTCDWKDSMGFSNAEEFHIRVASPWAKKFLISLQRIDEYISMLDYFWFNGLVEDRDHANLPRVIIRDILRYASMTINMEVNAFKYINSLDDADILEEIECNKMTEDLEPNHEIAPEDDFERRNLAKWASSEENI